MSQSVMQTRFLYNKICVQLHELFANEKSPQQLHYTFYTYYLTWNIWKHLALEKFIENMYSYY